MLFLITSRILFLLVPKQSLLSTQVGGNLPVVIDPLRIALGNDYRSLFVMLLLSMLFKNKQTNVSWFRYK